MKPFAILCLAAILSVSCKKKNDDNGGGNGGGSSSSAVEITNIPGGYPFWGDTITIAGNGFGSNVADVSVKYLANTSGNFTSASGNIKIISVSNTQLRITAPLGTTPGGNPTGPDYAKLIVTVKGKSDTSGNINFSGFPILGSMCYHYGGISHGATTRPGDSVIMQAGVQGLNGNASGYMDKLRLSVGGTLISTIRRGVGVCGGLAFNLDPVVFSELGNCIVIPGTFGQPARKMIFRLWIEGTNKETSGEYFVLNHPTMKITQVTGPDLVSISAGGNPALQITGKNIFINKIKWVGNGHSATTSTGNGGTFTGQLQVGIPLSVLQPNQTYAIIGEANCGITITIGNVQVIP